MRQLYPIMANWQLRPRVSGCSPLFRTTKLYDRRQQVTRGEVERIRYERKQSMPDAGNGQ